MSTLATKRIFFTDETSLHDAVKFGRLRLARLLLDGGKQVNLMDEFKETPLIKAVRTNFSDAQSASKQRMVSFLLENGADPNIQDKDGRTALVHSCQKRLPLEIILLLLDYGADVNLRDYWGRCAISYSLIYNDRNIVERLMKKPQNGTLPIQGCFQRGSRSKEDSLSLTIASSELVKPNVDLKTETGITGPEIAKKVANKPKLSRRSNTYLNLFEHCRPCTLNDESITCAEIPTGPRLLPVLETSQLESIASGSRQLVETAEENKLGKDDATVESLGQLPVNLRIKSRRRQLLRSNTSTALYCRSGGPLDEQQNNTGLQHVPKPCEHKMLQSPLVDMQEVRSALLEWEKKLPRLNRSEGRPGEAGQRRRHKTFISEMNTPRELSFDTDSDESLQSAERLKAPISMADRLIGRSFGGGRELQRQGSAKRLIDHISTTRPGTLPPLNVGAKPRVPDIGSPQSLNVSSDTD